MRIFLNSLATGRIASATPLLVAGGWQAWQRDILAPVSFEGLETEEERLERVGRYDFPDDLQWSVPAAPIITSFPGNDGRGESWGFDVFVQKRPGPGARLSGWASYTYGRAWRDQYGLELPFDYDRRHALSLVGNWRISEKFQLAATLRAFSGFPRTPVLGLRVSAEEEEIGLDIEEHGNEAYAAFQIDPHNY